MKFHLPAVTFLLSLAFTLPAAPLQTADGIEIMTDGGNMSIQRALEEIRALDRQITTLFKVTGRMKGYPCRIVLSKLLPKGELLVSYQSSGWLFSFNPEEDAWLHDFKLRRKLTGLLLLAKTRPARPPLDPDFLPGWISAGIDRRIRDSRRSEILLRRNRNLPVLRALSALDRFPDFNYMCRLDGSRLGGSALVWYGELSRALLDLSAITSTQADNALLDYAILCSRPGSFERQCFNATLRRTLVADAEKSALSGQLGPEQWNKLTPEQKIQLHLENYTKRLAWNEFSPKPAELALADLEKVMTMEYMELDKEGRPTGNTLSAPLTTLPELLLTRPDAEGIRGRQANRLGQLAIGNSVSFYRKLEQLQQTFLQLPLTRRQASPELAERFRRGLEELRTELEQRRIVERYLDEIEPELRIPSRFYAEAIREALHPVPWLLPAEEAYLDQMEAEWK